MFGNYYFVFSIRVARSEFQDSGFLILVTSSRFQRNRIEKLLLYFGFKIQDTRFRLITSSKFRIQSSVFKIKHHFTKQDSITCYL